MLRSATAGVLLVLLGFSSIAAAQTGAGSLRGYVKDEQGGALPGVTVTAKSDALIQPVVAATDSSGYFRLINLPPGTYTVVTELTGFATFRREDVLLRAGANFEVDATMKIAALAETITVSGESPMLEVSRPSNILNISGDFQREMPIQARRNWSDFLELTPGVHSRPFDDGSGRMVYFGHGTEHFAHVIQLEGAIASNYNDAQITYIAMGADMVEDSQVKTGGVDASAPMGVGLNINVITKRGGSTFKGSAAFGYQPDGWNSNNSANCSPSAACKPTAGATSTTAVVRQFDAGVGGPIVQNHAWFFASLRRADNAGGISRTGTELANLQMFFPGNALVNNTSQSWQPYGKVTARSGTHEVSAFYQLDRSKGTGNREYHYTPAAVFSTGGSLLGAKLTSTWGDSLTTTFVGSYNNKGGNDSSTFDGFSGSGPDTQIHRTASVNAGRMVGDGRILQGGNIDGGFQDLQPSSVITLRGDLTFYKNGWAGSHELQTGFFAAPHSTYDQERVYINNGFILEERRMVDPANAAAGTIPFHRQYVTPLDIKTRAARDRNLAFYVQDNWKPAERLTTNLGLRFDFVKRYDDIFKITREQAHIVQPRLGFSYLVTKNAKNVLRGSYARLGEQMMGRDAVTQFGGAQAASLRDEYDLNSDGVLETVQLNPATTATLAAIQFDPNVHQPYVDEFILGFRKQFPMQFGIDVAGIQRTYKDTYGQIDINGIYPNGPGKPFLGFGAVDPNRGRFYQQTNNSWSRLNYAALEITITKNMSHNLQLIAGINRQWQHISGTWNPTDPAAFVQPGAFPNDKLLYMPRGNNEEASLPLAGSTTVNTYGPTWQKYRMNFGGTYIAPFGISLAASYTVEAGPWSGPLVQRLAANDPQVTMFGPSTFTLANGTTQSNPLSTRFRFVNATRGDGQVMAPPAKALGLKIGKKIKLGGSRQAEVAANVFNITNAGDFTQYNYSGANETFNPNYLQMRNQQPARALQATFIYRF